MDNLDISERLAKLREANGYSMRELADRIGTSANTVMRWERGESSPSQEFCIALAELYGRDPVWLMFGLKKPSKAKSEKPLVDLVASRLELLNAEQLSVINNTVAIFLDVEVQGNDKREQKSI